MFTLIQLYYERLSVAEKKEFRKKVMKKVGSKATFYRHLKSEPPILVKEFLSKETNIEIDKLYKTVDLSKI